jgi:hypothetical protein
MVAQTLLFYPITNVMTTVILENENMANLDAGITRLQSKFDDDELIILVSETDEVGTDHDFRMLFNGKLLMTEYHESIKFGQPARGQMFSARFGTSPLYIDNLKFENDRIDFTLLQGTVGENFTDLSFEYLIVNKATNRVVYHATQTGITSAVASSKELFHTVEGVFSPANYKAVVYITDNDTGEFLQAASTERVLKPFRMMTDSPLVIIGDNDDKNTVTYRTGNFYFVNTNFTGTNTFDIRIQHNAIFMTEGMSFDFCDSNVCYASGWAHITLAEGDISSYFYATAYPWWEGFIGDDYYPIIERTGAIVQRFSVFLRFEPETYRLEFPIYFLTNDVDILVIQDDAGENTDVEVIETINNLVSINSSISSFGVYNPLFGDIDYNLFSETTKVIWNVSAVYPALPAENLDKILNIVENGSAIVTLGQYVANTLNDENLSTYANSTTKNFLNKALLTTNTATAVSVNNTINGLSNTLFAGMSLNLLNDGSPLANVSKCYIVPGVGVAIFRDSNDNLKGIMGYVEIGQATFLDFNLASIPKINQADVLDKSLNKGVSEIEVTVPTLQNAILHLYPNPVSSNLNIRLETQKSRSATSIEPEYAIYNIRGQRIVSGKLNPTNDGYHSLVNIERLPVASGIYFVKVKSDSEQNVSKMLILR